jgi:uncharacterized protein (TIGR02246 family)
LDPTGLEEIYADDADWTNAFGTSRHGRQAIVAYLRELFADRRFAAGKMVGSPKVSMRFASDDVAVVKAYLEREGQQLVGGGEIPLRRNHSLKVLVKRNDRWLILSEMYMDAREERTVVHQAPA